MWPDRASNPGPLTYESGALPTALSGPATDSKLCNNNKKLVYGKYKVYALVISRGARFTKDLNPKTFITAIQFHWNLRKY